ncbi:helix-turn-helix transcriptional regulator [Mesorhizobium sp. 1B3]|uniref:helix-turn-helix transcriptional regulator n=1 Tax=Mesorhizobium sp. 1B3 TaxID=3243599 RepID=UPI003D95D527
MATLPPSDDLLIDLIYSSLIGETHWQNFLDQVKRTLPEGQSTLFYHDANRGSGSFSLSSRIAQDILRDYEHHFSKINPWMPKAMVRPVGIGVVSEQMLAREDFVRTEFYNDFYRRTRSETAIGITIIRNAGVSFMLSTATKRSDPDANLTEANRLTRLAPHLKRAFDYYRRGSADRALAERVGPAFSILDVGLVLVGAHGHVKAMTPAAEDMIESGIGLSISTTGRLRSHAPAVDEALQAMTNLVAASPDTYSTITTQTRRSARITFVRVGKDPTASYFEGPTVLVLIDPIAKASHLANAETFAAAFSLTPSETMFLPASYRARLFESSLIVSGNLPILFVLN